MKSIVRIRASSLPNLFDCPARWAATHIDGKHMPKNGKALLGSAVHASTAVFDQSTLDSSGITIDEAAAAAVDVIHKPDEDVIWDEDKPNDVEKVAVALHKKYCTEIAPTQHYKAVEIDCGGLVVEDLGLELTGTTDRIRETSEGFGIVDIKTGKQAVGADGMVKTSGHAFQMGVYELLAEQGSGLEMNLAAQIVGLNTAKTDAAQRVGTGSIEGAKDVLLGDGEVPGVLEYASELIHRGAFYGNPKSMMCHQNYCPIFSTCKFKR